MPGAFYRAPEPIRRRQLRRAYSCLPNSSTSRSRMRRVAGPLKVAGHALWLCSGRSGALAVPGLIRSSSRCSAAPSSALPCPGGRTHAEQASALPSHKAPGDLRFQTEFPHWQVQPPEAFQSCVLRKWPFGLEVTWEQHRIDSLEGAKLGTREFKVRVFVPGDSLAGVHVQQPKMLSEVFYVPTLSRQHELGWVKSMARKDEPGFVSTEDLADACLAQFLSLHRKESR
jgi:hypothetical protein